MSILPKAWKLVKFLKPHPCGSNSVERFYDTSWIMEPTGTRFEMVYIKRGNAVFEISKMLPT